MSTTPTEPTPNNATVTTSTGGTVPVTTTAPAAPPPADPSKTDPPADKGYPANTSISDMTDGQKAAYFEERSRIEENRRKELLTLTGGKYGDALKADLDELARLRTERLTDSEKAVEEAKATTRAEVAAEYATKLVAAEFRGALAHVPEDRRGQIIENLALDKFLTTDGNVDTAKVTAHVAAIAPDKDMGGSRREFGQGNRTAAGGPTAGGLAAGAQLYADRNKKPTTTSS